MSTTIEFDASEYSIDSVNLYFSDRADVRFSRFIPNIETTKWLTLRLYL